MSKDPINIIFRVVCGLIWRIGNFIRGGLVRIQVPMIGTGTLFFGKVTIFDGEDIKIGKQVRFGDHIVLSTQEGCIKIEDSCVLSNGVEIISLGKIVIGQGTTLNKHVVVKGKGVVLGNNVWVAQNCILEGSNVHIGDRVIFGPYVHVNDGTHRIDPQSNEILMETGDSKPISIGENAWIGSGAMILPGVDIGPGAIIGARSVVTKDIPAFSVAVGNPARIIKNRITGEKF